MQYYLNEGLMKDLKIKLGMRIKYLRKAKNLTQEQLAEKINMDITSLSKTILSPKLLRNLLVHLKLT